VYTNRILKEVQYSVGTVVVVEPRTRNQTGLAINERMTNDAPANQLCGYYQYKFKTQIARRSTMIAVMVPQAVNGGYIVCSSLNDWAFEACRWSGHAFNRSNEAFPRDPDSLSPQGTIDFAPAKTGKGS
jgi:hypothetical protein